MKMEYNPSGVFDKMGTLQGFVAGSMIVSSFIFGIASESEIVMLFMIMVMVAGIMVFISSLLRGGENVYFWMVVGFMVVGGVVSFVASLLGMLALGVYLLIMLVVAVIVQTRRFWKKK